MNKTINNNNKICNNAILLLPFLIFFLLAKGVVVANSNSFIVLSNGTCSDFQGQYEIQDYWSCMEAGKKLGYITPVSKDDKGFYKCPSSSSFGADVDCSKYIIKSSDYASGCLHDSEGIVNSQQAITTNTKDTDTVCGAHDNFLKTMDCICFKGPVCNDTSGTKNNSDTCMCGKSVCTEASGRYCTVAGTVANQPVDQCNQLPLCTSRDGRYKNSESCTCGSTSKVVQTNYMGGDKFYGYLPVVCTEDTGLYCFSDQTSAENRCSKKSVTYSWKNSNCNDEHNTGYIFDQTDCNNAAKDLDFADDTASYANSQDLPPGCYKEGSTTLMFNAKKKGGDCDAFKCLCASAPTCKFQDGKTSNSNMPYCICGDSLCTENTGLYCSSVSGCAKVPTCAITNASKPVESNCQCGGSGATTECSAGQFCYVSGVSGKKKGQCNQKQVMYQRIYSGKCDSLPGGTFVSGKGECMGIATMDGFKAPVSKYESDTPQGCYWRMSYLNLFWNSKKSGVSASTSYRPYCAIYLFDCEHGNGMELNQYGCKCGTSVCEYQNQYCLHSENRCSSNGPIYPTTTTKIETTTKVDTTTQVETTTTITPIVETTTRKGALIGTTTPTPAVVQTSTISSTTQVARPVTTSSSTTTTTELPPHMHTSTPFPEIANIIIEQKIEFRGTTKEKLEASKKKVEKALAKSLGVAVETVNIIDIIEVQKRRRILLGIYVEVIYEVDVKDDVEAQRLELAMKADEFKSTINNNIQTETPDLKATVESIEEPKVTKNYKKKNSDKKIIEDNNDNGQVNTDNDTRNKNKTMEIVIISVIIISVILCVVGGIIIYYCFMKQNNGSDDELKNDLKNEHKRRNTWDLSTVELNNRNNPWKQQKKAKKMRNKNGRDKTPSTFSLNPVRASAIGFAIDDKLTK
jgi:hypothetical protein